MIQEVLGDRVRVFDGGNGTAREMKRRLAEKGLLTDSTAAGTVDFQNSLTGQSHEDKIQLCKALFNKKFSCYLQNITNLKKYKIITTFLIKYF